MKYTKNCLPRRGKESFSDLFERLIDENIHNGIDALKKFEFHSMGNITSLFDL